MNLIDMQQLATNKAKTASSSNMPILGALSNGDYRNTKKMTDDERKKKAIIEELKDKLNYHLEDQSKEVWD